VKNNKMDKEKPGKGEDEIFSRKFYYPKRRYSQSCKGKNIYKDIKSH